MLSLHLNEIDTSKVFVSHVTKRLERACQYFTLKFCFLFLTFNTILHSAKKHAMTQVHSKQVIQQSYI